MDGDGHLTFWRGFWAMPHVRWWTYALAADFISQGLFAIDHTVVQIVAAALGATSVLMAIWGPIATWLEFRHDDPHDLPEDGAA